MGLRNNGIFLILLSDFFFAILPILVKTANHLGYSPVQVVFFRFAFAGLGIMALAVWGWQKIRVVNRQAVFWRGFFGGFTVVFYFLALQGTTAAKATLLNYTYSVWANVFAVLFLRRKAPRSFWPLLSMAAVGVWLVLGVKFGGVAPGDLWGTLSGVMAGAGVLSVKEARRTDNALTVFGSLSLGGLILSASLLVGGFFSGAPPRSLVGWSSLSAEGWGLLLAMGGLSMAAQLFFTQGLGHASLPVGTLLSLLVPILAALLGFFFLKEPLTPHFLLGTGLVLTACGLFAKEEGNSLGS